MSSFLVCFTGVDGSGKTVLAKKLVSDLRRKGMSAEYIWFRFPYLFTLGILLLAKLTGYTVYKRNDIKRISIHNFNNAFFRTLYPITLLIDTLINYVIKIYIPLLNKKVIVCDRWITDIIVDISVDIGNLSFIQSFIGRVLFSLSIKSDAIFLLDAPDRLLDERRPEAFLDPFTDNRRSLYRSLVYRYMKTNKMKLLSSIEKVDNVYESIKNEIKDNFVQ